MPAREANDQAQDARCGGPRDLVLLALMMYALANSGEALAADPTAAESEFGPLDLSRPLSLNVTPGFALPRQAEPAPAAHEFSATEFSPRRRIALGGLSPNGALGAETPSLRTTTVWQRLNDYRSHDRVRLVTLWESSGSSLSIQAGKRGEPSLQWSSRAMNRGGATRGLLDQVIAASLGAAGIGQLRGNSHPAHVAQPASPAKQVSILPSLAKTP